VLQNASHPDGGGLLEFAQTHPFSREILRLSNAACSKSRLPSPDLYNFGMPNIHDIRIPAPDPEIPWDDRIAWTIPIDDDLFCALMAIDR
jgi:hypothetical protein